MFLEGTLYELMVKLVLDIYHKYVIMSSKWKPLLYVMIQKVFYIILRSTLLYYINQVKDIDTYWFKLNPYNAYIKNNQLLEKQMKVVCQVDDLKVSHVYSFDITNIYGYL